MIDDNNDMCLCFGEQVVTDKIRSHIVAIASVIIEMSKFQKSLGRLRTNIT